MTNGSSNNNNNGRDGDVQRRNDWSQDPESSEPPDTQQPPSADEPTGVPPEEPADWQAPGPQGARQPAGGEWSGGHAHQLNPPGADTPNDSWGEGPGHPEGGQIEQPRLDQPPAKRPGAASKLEQNDIIAMILSFFFPGVGQLMLGQSTKGIVILLVSFFTCAAGGLISIASILDTYCVAMTKKKRPVDEWEFFPDMGEHF